MVGRTIAHYTVLEKLGEGGMGVVYKARDTHLERFVAIKVLPPEKVADSDRKRRFVQEAKAASALNHPNIITIYDIDQRDGVDFIAMEYVEGKTLDRLIPQNGMRVHEALQCAGQIADALAQAHAAGIIHRDLKPGNIMVDEQGLVRVLDFGLAKLTEAALGDQDGATRTINAITEEGTIIGTAAYMSPEQAEGKKLDARSDIFSFGTLLYQMITGRQPFLRDTRTATLAAILRDDPPPPDGVPPGMAQLTVRCLRKDPERRIQRLVDAKLALEELKAECDSGQVAQPRARIFRRTPARRRLFLAFAGTLAAVAAVAGIAWLTAINSQQAQSAAVPLPLTSMGAAYIVP